MEGNDAGEQTTRIICVAIYDDAVIQVLEGSDIYERHPMLLARNMGYGGSMQGMNRFGVLREKSSPISRASFEVPVDILTQSSICAEKDELSGINENGMIGNVMKMGSALTDVVLPEEPMKPSMSLRLRNRLTLWQREIKLHPLPAGFFDRFRTVHVASRLTVPASGPLSYSEIDDLRPPAQTTMEWSELMVQDKDKTDKPETDKPETDAADKKMDVAPDSTTITTKKDKKAKLPDTNDAPKKRIRRPKTKPKKDKTQMTERQVTSSQVFGFVPSSPPLVAAAADLSVFDELSHWSLEKKAVDVR